MRGGARRNAAAALLCGLAALSAHAQEAAPFATLNLSPTEMIFAPSGWARPTSGTRITASAAIANDYRISAAGDDRLVLDGETWRTSLALQHGFGARWTAGVEIPYYRHSGGVLDDFIDAWHSAFNLPDESRNASPEDRLLFLLESGSRAPLRLQSATGGIGDAELALGRRLGPLDDGYFLRAVVKLPTGNADRLTGSGAADFALTVMRSQPLRKWNRPAGFFWGVGAARLGQAERIPYDQRRGALLGLVGVGVKVWPRTGFKVQVDARTALYDSPLKELGSPAVELGIGGWRELRGRRSLEFAVDEDLNVGTAPDVALHLAYEWNL
jgi:hypothetical protein